MKKIIIAIFVLAIIVFAGIFIVKSITGNTISSNVKEFTIQAFRFGYTPDTITVNKGDKVKIIIDNVDAAHGINLPDFNVQSVDSIEFTADKSGEFYWNCLVPCGPGHREMTGKLIVK